MDNAMDVATSLNEFRLIQPNETLENIKEAPAPIGLSLTPTPSLLNLIMQLNESRSQPTDLTTQSRPAERSRADLIRLRKASNIPALSLQIGNYKRRGTQYAGDLVAKIYYAKQAMIWEMMKSEYNRKKIKIEFKWEQISAIAAGYDLSNNDNDKPDWLEIQLNKPPKFFKEKDLVPGRHTQWDECEDFTDDFATSHRRHKLHFPKGTLKVHFEKLLANNDKLSQLSKQNFPYWENLFFPKLNENEQMNIGVPLRGDLLYNSFKPLNSSTYQWRPKNIQPISGVVSFSDYGPAFEENSDEFNMINGLQMKPGITNFEAPCGIKDPSWFVPINPTQNQLQQVTYQNDSNLYNPTMNGLTSVDNVKQELHSFGSNINKIEDEDCPYLWASSILNDIQHYDYLQSQELDERSVPNIQDDVDTKPSFDPPAHFEPQDPMT